MAGAGSDGRIVAVTGADGFIGRALAAHLRQAGFDVRAVTRRSNANLAAADIAQLASALRGVDTVFHLAARAHVMRENAADPRAAFHAANVTATERVARAAIEAGARRFVHASTAKVSGETTEPGRPFRIDDTPQPRDDYARSKWRAEQSLQRIAGGSPMSVSVLRLPLVYGPGVRGNFRTLWEAVAQRQWLPFAAIENRRSMIGLPNVVDAFAAAADAPPGTYFVADEENISTPQLVRSIAEAQRVEISLARVPVALLRVVGVVTGRSAAIHRLTSSLEVDAGPFREASGWMPQRTLAQTLAVMARGES